MQIFETLLQSSNHNFLLVFSAFFFKLSNGRIGRAR